MKEIISDIFVEKTKKIIAVWNSEWHEINFNNRTLFQSPLNGSNFKSIIVTSTNNEAVDNIGKELINEISYLLDNNNKEDISSFCAQFGKKEIMDAFVEILNKKMNIINKYKDIQSDDSRQLIEKFNKLHDEITSFNKIASTYIRLKRELIKKYDITTEDISSEYIEKKIKKLDNIIYNLNEHLRIINDEIISYDYSVENLISSNYKYKEDLNKSVDEKEYKMRIKNKHNKFIKFKKIGEIISRIIYGDIKIINQQIDNIEPKIIDLRISIEKIEERINEIKNLQDKRKTQVVDIENEIYNKRIKISDYKTYLNQYNIFNQEIKNLNINISPDEVEYNIYNNEVILNKRNCLFNLSLRINDKFIFKNSDKIINNLEYVNQDSKWFKSFYSGDYRYNSTKERNIRIIWETFCLCFPVITTTLHSFEKNKFHMIKELFDTLLVDEA